jgi:hypothetical protein
VVNDAAEFALWLSPHILANVGRVLATVLKTPEDEVGALHRYLRRRDARPPNCCGSLLRPEGRGTQELMTLYVAERWLARLSASPYTDRLVIMGGVLLAAHDARRPTADLDALTRSVANDEAAFLSPANEIALLAPSLRDRDSGREVPPRRQLRRPGHACSRRRHDASASVESGARACSATRSRPSWPRSSAPPSH